MRNFAAHALLLLPAFQSWLIQAAPTPQDDVSEIEGNPLIDLMNPFWQILDAADQSLPMWCSRASELSDEDQAAAAFRIARPDLLIANLVRGENRTSWLAEFEKLIFVGSGLEYVGYDSGAATRCSRVDGDCDPGTYDQCGDYWHAADDLDTPEERHMYGYALKRAFWIFKLVSGAHDKLSMFHAEIQKSVVFENLNLRSIIDDFGVPAETSIAGGFESMLFAAMGLAGGAIGGPAGGTLGVASTVLSSLPVTWTEGDEPDNLGEIQEGLGVVLKSWTAGIEKVLRTAIGEPEGYDDDAYEDLPELSVYGGTESNIAKFYGTPFWLLNVVNTPIDEALDSIGKNLKQKLVDIILQTGGWVVGMDPQVDRGDCDLPYQRWVTYGDDGEGGCFSMFEESLDKVDSSIHETMFEHGITSLNAYFEIAVDCAKKGGSGDSEIDTSDVIGIGHDIDGDVPRCFFSIPVKKLAPIEYDSEIVHCNDMCLGLQDLFD